MMVPICIDCRRYRPRVRDAELGPNCDAFPGGIPREILFEGADHRLPWPGDNGVLFLAKDDEAAESVARTWGRKPKAYKPRKLPPGIPPPDALRSRS
jgi:hypothetical protein